MKRKYQVGNEKSSRRNSTCKTEEVIFKATLNPDQQSSYVAQCTSAGSYCPDPQHWESLKDPGHTPFHTICQSESKAQSPQHTHTVNQKYPIDTDNNKRVVGDSAFSPTFSMSHCCSNHLFWTLNFVVLSCVINVLLSCQSKNVCTVNVKYHYHPFETCLFPAWEEYWTLKLILKIYCLISKEILYIS